MSKIKRIVGAILTIIVACGVFYFLVYYRFAHPELTETQSLMALWKEILLLFVMGTVAMILNE